MRTMHVVTAAVSLSLAFATIAAAAQSPPTSEAALGGTFSPAGSLVTGRYAHTATLVPDGRVLVLVGHDPIPGTEPEVWDPATGTFGPTGPMVQPRFTQAATTLADGRVLVVGGTTGTSTEIWDPVTGTFNATGSLLVSRAYPTATLLRDGRVLVVGGAQIEQPVGSMTAEIWDPVTGTFTSTGSLAVGRFWHSAVLLRDGRVLVVDGQGSEVAHTSAEVWDPVTGTFTPAGTLDQEGVAMLLSDGRVLVAGSETAQLWDPTTEAFGPTVTLDVPRWGSTFTPLPDGRVLIAGGYIAGDPDVEGSIGSPAPTVVWDPQTGSSIPSGQLAAPRDGHTATLLSDGRVLIVGGYDEQDETLVTSAEVWEPAEG